MWSWIKSIFKPARRARPVPASVDGQYLNGEVDATRLQRALRRNADTEGGVALMMDTETSFVATIEREFQEEENDQVINAIRSMPTHY